MLAHIIAQRHQMIDLRMSRRHWRIQERRPKDISHLSRLQLADAPLDNLGDRRIEWRKRFSIDGVTQIQRKIHARPFRLEKIISGPRALGYPAQFLRLLWIGSNCS